MNKIIITVILLFILFNVLAQDEKSKAIELYKNNQKQEAYYLFTKLFKEKPNDPDINYYLGMLYLDKNEPEIALSYLLKTKEIDNKYKYIANELSYLYMQLRKYSLAIEYAKKSIIDYPDYILAYLNLTSILVANKDYSEFEKYLIIAAQKDSQYVLSFADSIITNYNMPKLALRYYEVLYKVIPNNPLLLHHMGAVYDLELKDTKKAYQFYKIAYYNSVYDKDVFFTIYASYMWSLIRQNKYNQIREDAFLKVDKNYPDAYYYIALSYYSEGNMDLFIKNADKYFKLKNEKKPVDLNKWAENILK